jgi:tRNA-2-methylthio-N6-dimethylallyladenosine synthase
MKRVYIETYGCQMNVADSDLLMGVLKSDGFHRTQSPAEADVIVLNTCAVRERAEERVLARARELSAHKKQNKEMVLAVVGCMAEHLKESLPARAPWVDVVAGPDTYRRLPDLLARSRDSESTVLDVRLDKSEIYEGLSGAEGGDGVSGFVTIQRGCDKFCTFCVVPFTRGRERGVPPREVLRQVREFVASGYKEVVLLGQTVNSYVYEDVTFAELLRAVARTEGVARVRFTSPYPVDFTDDVIAAIAEEPAVCKYLHLPLQSGSDAVLERMRRGYDVAGFRALVLKLRERIPQIALSTDILSGFSGESEEDHQKTLAAMNEFEFDSAFMFSYSERSLTYAAKNLPDDVTPEIKKRRLREIIALQESISARVFARQVGKVEPVLVHSDSRRKSDQVVGRTDGFKSVILPKGALRPGDMVLCRIERSTLATLFGSPVGEQALDTDGRDAVVHQ